MLNIYIYKLNNLPCDINVYQSSLKNMFIKRTSDEPYNIVLDERYNIVLDERYNIVLDELDNSLF